MKIALLGYGKMGKAIEQLASQRGHTIGTTIDNEEEWGEHIDALRGCDVAIDFSTPSTAIGNIKKCFEIGMSVVVGTTGWYDQLDNIVAECKEQGQSLFVASNFSIGMNIMFDLNRRLAELMTGRDEYQVSLTETHHIHKLDAPSGTAITLANDINSISAHERMPIADIVSIREGEIAGIHEVVYDSDIDTIRLSHSAKSRKGLALGALLAAEFLLGKKGYFTMRDLLNQ